MKWARNKSGLILRVFELNPKVLIWEKHNKVTIEIDNPFFIKLGLVVL